MNKAKSNQVKLPRRTVDTSALGEEAAQPEEALLLLTTSTCAELSKLSDEARLEIRDLIYELGRTAQNTAFPTIRVDLDLELEPPQDWCASVSLEGYEVRTFGHSKASVAYALGVREAIIQATSIGLPPRATMIADWSTALGKVCEQLDELSLSVRAGDLLRDLDREKQGKDALQRPADLAPNSEKEDE